MLLKSLLWVVGQAILSGLRAVVEDPLRVNRPAARHRRSRPSWLVALVTLAGVAAAGTAATSSHTVSPGDTLSQLAAKHGVSVAALAKANDIDDPDRIPAGMELVIPGAEEGEDAKNAKNAKDPQGAGEEAKGGSGDEDGEADVAATATDATDATDGNVIHVVAPGETLSHIAARYGVTVRALAEANGIADVHRITAGQRLAIPGPRAGSGDRPPPTAGASLGASSNVDTSRFPALLQASPDRLALVPRFQHWAEVYGVPLDLLMAMTWLESGWQDDVVSSAGAMGIGQLMPDTVTWMRDVIIGEPLDPFDADDNIRMSAAYLRWLLDRTGGDPATALAGYYQGLGAVRSVGIFPSTRVYVADVLAFRDRHF